MVWRVRVFSLIVALALVGLLAGPAGATTIYNGFLTASSGTYTLLVDDLNDGNPNTYYATLTVATSNAPGVYIDWFLVHFDTPAATINGGITATTGSWVVGDGTTPVYGYANGQQNFPTGPYTGGYVSGLSASNQTGGFALNGLTNSWAFYFSSAAPILGQGGYSNPNLQVGFYGPGATGYPRLSQGFQPVPEPATMLLVGTGLVGLAGIGRKRFRK